MEDYTRYKNDYFVQTKFDTKKKNKVSKIVKRNQNQKILKKLNAERKSRFDPGDLISDEHIQDIPSDSRQSGQKGVSHLKGSKKNQITKMLK